MQCLLISEVKVLLQVQKANRMSGGGVVNPVMLKSISYCDKFSKFSDRQTVKDIRNLFDQEYAQYRFADPDSKLLRLLIYAATQSKRLWF